MTKRYNLTLMEEQLNVIVRACDVLSRLHDGDFSVIVKDVLEHNPRNETETAEAYYACRWERYGQDAPCL